MYNYGARCLICYRSNPVIRGSAQLVFGKKKIELVLPPIQSDLEPSLTGSHVQQSDLGTVIHWSSRPTVRSGNSHSLVVTSTVRRGTVISGRHVHSKTWEQSLTGRHVHTVRQGNTHSLVFTSTVRPGTVILWSSRPYSQTLNSHPLVVTYEQRQLVVFSPLETVAIAMPSYFVLFCLTLLTIVPLCSMAGQTLTESTISMLLVTGENATAEVLDQQQNGDVITPQDRENIALLCTVLQPFLLFFGTFGNVMTVIIHKSTTQTSPMSVFFIVLALADLTLLYSNCFVAWIYFTFHFDIATINHVSCKLVMLLSYVSGVLSAWTLVAMTVQRAVCVLWPHRANVLCTVGKSKVIVISMSIFIAGIHAHMLYGIRVTIKPGYLLCGLSDEYISFFNSVWSWVDLLIFCILPWLCLSISNSLLVWKLKVSVREAEASLGSGQVDKATDRKKKATSITVTLIAVSFTFLICTFPMSFAQVLVFIAWLSGSLKAIFATRGFYYIQHISRQLWYINSCLNFYIYCLTGSKFRREAKQIFSCLFQDLDTCLQTGRLSLCREV